MMWKYIYAAFLMIAFTACHTNKTLEKSDKPASTANYTLPEHLSVRFFSHVLGCVERRSPTIRQ